MKNEKYCAAVASVSWLTDAAYPLRVHTVFLRFPNFELSQKSRLGLLAKLCGVALKNGAGRPKSVLLTPHSSNLPVSFTDIRV